MKLRLKSGGAPATSNSGNAAYTHVDPITEPRQIRRAGPKGLLLYLELAIIVLGWSFNYIFGKIAIAEVQPYASSPGVAVAVSRLLISAVVFVAVQPLLGAYGRLQPLTRHDLFTLAVLGFSGITLNQYFFVTGLGKTSVAHSSLIIALTPVVVLLMAATVGQERVTAIKASGMVVALAGVALLVWKAGGGTVTLVGDLTVTGAALTFGFYTVASKGVVERFSTFSFNYYVYLIGAVLMLPLGVGVLHTTKWAGIPLRGWLSILYMAVIGSAIAYTVYYEVMRTVSASQVAALSYLQPVIATLAGALVLPGEKITTGLVLGGTIILAGVYLTERG